jgi:hypothetical protein
MSLLEILKNSTLNYTMSRFRMMDSKVWRMFGLVVMAGILLVVPDSLTTSITTITITSTMVTTRTTTTMVANLKAVNPQDVPFPPRGLSALELVARIRVTAPAQVSLHGAEGTMANFALDHAV